MDNEKYKTVSSKSKRIILCCFFIVYIAEIINIEDKIDVSGLIISGIKKEHVVLVLSIAILYYSVSIWLNNFIDESFRTLDLARQDIKEIKEHINFAQENKEINTYLLADSNIDSLIRAIDNTDKKLSLVDSIIRAFTAYFIPFAGLVAVGLYYQLSLDAILELFRAVVTGMC